MKNKTPYPLMSVGSPLSQLLQKNNSETVAQSIRWVAESLHETTEFQSRAVQAAQDLGSSAVPALSRQFHNEHTPPEHLKAKFPDLGGWIAARQFAIFEMLYYIGAPALPLLRKVAHGEYDWIQGNAVEVLCRLAATGLEREQIMQELTALLPNLRYEALLYAAGPLSQHAKSNAQVAAAFDALLLIPQFAEAHEELKQPRN